LIAAATAEFLFLQGLWQDGIALHQTAVAAAEAAGDLAGHARALAHVRDPSIDAAATAVDKLRTIVSRYTSWHARHHVAARVCQFELAGLTSEHYDEILQVRHQTNRVFRDIVAHGVDEGVFAPVDVRRVVRSMLSLSIDLVRWYRLDGPDSPEQLGEFYSGLALKMVMNTVPAELAPPPSADRRNGRASSQARTTEDT